MNIYEDINRIKEVMGLIVEQSVPPVSIIGEQPYPNGTDWDSVHGILGSRKIDDDLEKRVGDKLKSGSYRVTNVKVSSYVSGNKVITDGTVTLVSDTNNPDIAFTTRGSINDNYEQRHDSQVNGLVDRLSAFYQGTARQFGPFIVDVKGTTKKYKQSFFAISKNNKSLIPNKPVTNNITTLKSSGRDLNSLNANFKKVVSDFINQNGDTIKNYNVKNFTITPNRDSVESSISLIKDENGYNGFSILFNPKGQPQESKNNALSKNLDSKIIKNGVINFPNEYEYHLIGLHV